MPDAGFFVKRNGVVYPTATIPGPAGPPATIPFVNGAYLERSTPGSAIFVGPVNPHTLGLMQVGDAWLNTEPGAFDGSSDAIEALLPDRLKLDNMTEAIQDTVAQMVVSGANIELSYNDEAGTLQVTAVGGDAEFMRDTLGAALVGTNGVSVAVNDAEDTIVFSISGLTIAQVTGLQAALDGKAASAHTHGVIELTATGTRSASTYLRGDNTWATPTNTTYSVPTQAEAETGTATTARAFSAQRVNQAIQALAPVKVADLAGKANTSHGHAIADVTGLQTALDSKLGALSYTNALAGSRFTILYDGSSWPGSRPSARTDIYFDLIGGSSAVADPAWMLNGDAREIIV